MSNVHRIDPEPTWLDRLVGWFQTRWPGIALMWLGRRIARGWLAFREILSIAWACRAALATVLIGGGLIVGTDQARDIVIASAAPRASLWSQAVLILSILFWAGMAWYWARITLRFRFALRSLPARIGGIGKWRAFWIRQMPRIIGALAVTCIAIAFWQARTSYRLAGATVNADLFAYWFWGMIVLAAAFYGVTAARRRILLFFVGTGADRHDKAPASSRPASPRPTSPRIETSWRRHFVVQHEEQFDRLRQFANPVAWTVLVISLVLSPLLMTAFAADPVGWSALFRSPVNAVLFGLGAMVPVISMLVLLSARTRVPWFGTVVTWMIVSPMLAGDNHDVRKLGPVDADARPHIRESFEQWYALNAGADGKMTVPINPHGPPVVVPPFIVVATAGGASRAAYWTSQVLAEITAREDGFADRLFLISGVSGGSLGAVTFRSLVEADRQAARAHAPRIRDFPAVSSRILRTDFLNATLSAGLYVDLPLHAFPGLAPDDRAAALEKAWERGWAGARAPGPDAQEPSHHARFDWDCGFLEVFAGMPGPHSAPGCAGSGDGAYRAWPILALNGTSVEKGKRIITTNVRLQGTVKLDRRTRDGLSDRIVRYDAFDILQSDIRISTSATMSARFPVVSPTGGMRDRQGTLWARVTDGGLYENFGAATADEVLRYIVERRDDTQEMPGMPDPFPRKLVWPMVILISSDPALDRLEFVRPRRQGTPDCQLVGQRLSAEVPAGRNPMPVHPGNGRPECDADPRPFGRLMLDPLFSLYNGRVARGEAAAVTLLGRIIENRTAIRNHLLKMTAQGVDSPADARDNWNSVLDRLQTDGPPDFFHFRQCKVPGFHGPTMSWHDSSNAWDVMDIMKGLDQEHGDPCGNRSEFVRLCTRLAVLTRGAAREDAEADCARRWGPKSMHRTPAMTAEPSKQPGSPSAR